jgi:hypothetical protein
VPAKDKCTFASGATAAFCDTFDQRQAGGRGGDLDPARWSVARLGASNLGQGMYDELFPATEQYCASLRTHVLPDRDSFVCGPQFHEPSHWMTSLNDAGGAPVIAARILQPFDFANRTGTIAFDVDAKTAGSHTWWPELWISDRPEALPHDTIPETGPPLAPRNGIGVVFAGANCPTRALGGKSPTDRSVGWGAVSRIDLVRGYQGHDVEFQPVQQPCFRVLADHANHFELRLSRQRLELWGSDYTSNFGVTFPRLRRLLIATGLNLPFTRGWVSFEQAHYNAHKGGVSSMQTYHWHGLGFDGPVLPAERAYQVPDALQKRFVWPSKTKYDGYNLGYPLDGRAFALRGVDLGGAQTAWLSLTLAKEDDGVPHLRFRLNGGAWQTYADPRGSMGYASVAMLVPLQLAELRSGTNTLQLSGDGSSRASVANIDLLVDPSQTRR